MVAILDASTGGRREAELLHIHQAGAPLDRLRDLCAPMLRRLIGKRLLRLSSEDILLLCASPV
jgi:hypothetical protein